ncbi:MAG TPA: M48 family metalloprotease [Burkholderiales bacterium]|jgi:predicted Zn-dependent protease
MSSGWRWTTAALLAALAGPAAAASIDFGRIFDVGRDLTTAAKGMDESEEIAVGREVAGRTLGAAPLVADPELQAYVNRVGRWIAMQTERPDLPWHFGVLDTSSINAFAAPGGYVLVTRGLYEMLETESQLAGVLAHEIGHIVQRHHVKVMQHSALVSAGARASQRDRNLLVNNLIGTGAEVLARGLDKSAEFEADRIGVVLAARAGYSPYGLVEVLHLLAARSADDATLALLFKTHPAPGERLTQLADVLEPRVAALPTGKEPAIRQVSPNTPPPAAAKPAKPAPAESASALQQEEGGTTIPSTGASGGGLDAGGVFRGIFGR